MTLYVSLVAEKVRKTSTATGLQDGEDLQKRGFLRGRSCGRYVYLRPITFDLRAVTVDGVARIKYLQMETFSDMRSMRAVFRWVFFIGRVSSTPLALHVNGVDRLESSASSKPPRTALKPQSPLSRPPGAVGDP
jgi:hypothetical protein